jgi:predicted membrane protein
MRNDRFERRIARAEERLEKRWARRARFGPLNFNSGGSISARLVIGVAIIAWGALYLADSLGIISGHGAGRFVWAIIFTAIGITTLIERRSSVSRYWAYAWLTAGLIEFSYHFYLIPVGIQQLFFPLVLLFVGSRLVQRAMNSPTDSPTDSVFTSNSQSRIFALLAGSQTRTFTQPLTDCELVAILSGIKLDLGNATIEGDRATLQVTAVMGGIEIYAPSDWNIVSDVTPILGAYIDKRRPTATLPTKTLVISGVVVMGGIEVKN